MLFSPGTRRERRVQLRFSERRLLLMAGDVLAVLLAVFAALLIWSLVAERTFTLAFLLPEVYWFFVLSGLWLLLASANDFYDLNVAASRYQTVQRLIVITGQLLVVYLIVFFLSPRDALPRLFILYYGGLSFVLIGLWRLLNPALIGWAAQARHILIIGTDWAAREMIAAIHDNSEAAYEVYGIIGRPDEVGQVINGVPVVGTAADLMNFIRRDRIRELVLTSTSQLDGATFQAIMDAYQIGIGLVPMPLLYERLTGRVPVEHLQGSWSVVLPIDEGSIFNPYPVAKRILEVSGAAVGLLLLGLLLPFIALAIKLDSPGTIFYGQNRVGLNGRVFKVWKFRSMVADAEKHTGATFAQSGDPRVTRVGRFMRKTRVDELPQLYNILRGDMSLIGPRPERPEHVERLQQKIPFYRTRLIVRPGLSGWAQVRFGYGADDDDALVKLQYDLYYIRHQSLLLDASILVRTVGRVLRMSGQ